MSLFGKILAILNLAALGGFVYMASVDFQMRHAWSYAVFRWEVALDGMPLDEADTDQQGRPRYINMTEKLCIELVDDATIHTQEEFLDRRKDELMARIEDDKVKPSKVDKIVEVLVALAETPGERDHWLTSRANQTPANAQDLRSKLETAFDKVKQPRESDKDRADRDGKRLAVARALVSLLDVLPTEEEKKKPVANPADDPVYRRTANALGVRMMARALDLQGQDYAIMALNVGEIRLQERIAFVYQHQSLLNLLQHREHQVREQADKLAVALKQAKIQEERAEQQEGVVTLLDNELRGKRAATQKELDRLVAEQEKLYRIRLKLRDANKTNQKMEQDIRKLESELESENP